MGNVLGQALVVIQQIIALEAIDILEGIVQRVLAVLIANTASLDATMENATKILVQVWPVIMYVLQGRLELVEHAVMENVIITGITANLGVQMILNVVVLL